MAAHTKIIDLFGLPACGKTTLCQYLHEQLRDRYKVATLNMLIEEARNNKIKLLFSFSLKMFIASVKVHKATPSKKNSGSKVSRFYLLKHSLYYTYAMRFSKYDFIFADHGDIQSFVSMEGGVDFHENRFFCQACSKYIDVSPVAFYVYCDILPELSLKRMVKRNTYQGRIERIKDNGIRLKELELEKERFDFFSKLLKKKGSIFQKQDMSLTTEHIANEIYSLLEK